MKYKLMLFAIIISVIILFRANIVSGYLSYSFKFPVTLHDIRFTKSGLEISDFQIKNADNKHVALAVDRMDVTIDWLAFFRLKGWHIRQMNLDKIDIRVDMLNVIGGKTNWSKILKPSKRKEKRLPFQIDLLHINSLNIYIHNLGIAGVLGATSEQHYNDITFNDIRSQKGFPIYRIIHRLFDHANIEKLLEKVLTKIPKKLLGTASERSLAVRNF